jgi:hypothetical protein
MTAVYGFGGLAQIYKLKKYIDLDSKKSAKTSIQAK